MSLLTLFLPRGGGGGAVVPTVTTDSVASITISSAVVVGTVSSDGGSTITERGFVYSSSNPVPTILDTKAVISGTTGVFSDTLAGLVSNTTHYFRAYATNAVGTSYGVTLSFVTLAVTNVHKHYFYRIYKNNVYNTTWTEEVISDPVFRLAINSLPSELNITISRDFDDFGEDEDVRLNNRVEMYVVDKETPTGRLLYSGYISGYKPVIKEDEQYIEITVFSYGVELSRQILTDISGNTTITYNSYDPANILKDAIDKYRARGGYLNYSSTSIDLTNTSVSYTFNTNTVKEVADKVIELCPVGWYYYIGADNLIYLKPKHDTADHTFTIGYDIENLETFRRVEDLVNRVLFTGGGSPPLYRKYENTDSQGTYGLYEIKIVDERVTVTATAQTIANRVLNNQKDPEIRSLLTIVDSNGARSTGYDIESVQVGSTMRIKNLRNNEISASKWDIAVWDQDVWDQSLSASAVDVIQILSLAYYPDSIVIEASSRLPQVAKRIEDINRNLQNSQTVDNPVAPS